MPDSSALKLKQSLEVKNMMLVTAESCTGGMIGAAITDISGSSKIYDRGFITYSNEAKMELLGVPAETLIAHGAVSPETAKEMAEGALKASQKAHVSVSVTGIAGPDGGSAEKPVGLVYIAVGLRGKDALVFRHEFKGDRDAVRKQTVDAAFAHLLEAIA